MQEFNHSLIKSTLVDLIQQQTENPYSLTKDIVHYLRDWFNEQGITNVAIDAYPKNEHTLHNIVATLGNGSEKIILSGHLDTVPAGQRKDWDENPFGGVEKNGNIYGRGSSDMKGGVAGILGCMLMLQDEAELLDKYQIVFAGTSDEESGMTGAAHLKEIGVMDDAICLVIPEATNLNVGIAEKGVIWGKITVYGKAAHGSMPEKGVNAIEGAAKLFPYLHTALDPNLHNKWLGKSTLNIGKVYGGNKTNVVPDRCIIETDYRLIPEEYDSFESNLRQVLEGFTAYKTNLEIAQRLTPVQSDVNQTFIKNLVQISTGKLVGTTYATDAGHLINQSFSPIPFVIYGPGDPTIIHKVNEFVPFEDVAKFSSTLAETLIKTYT